MSEEEAPEPAEQQMTTGSVPVVDNGGSGMWLRTLFALCLGALFVGSIALYSLHQALHSRVESQEHRIERLNKMLTDMLASGANAEKIEKIEQKMSGIEASLDELNATLKHEHEQEHAKPKQPEAPEKGKR
jgi:uncharacterized coiled-coil protein SlyX